MLEFKEGVSLRKQVNDYMKPVKMSKGSEKATHLLTFAEKNEDPTYIYAYAESLSDVVGPLQAHPAVEFVNVLEMTWIGDETFKELTGIERKL